MGQKSTFTIIKFKVFISRISFCVFAILNLESQCDINDTEFLGNSNINVLGFFFRINNKVRNCCYGILLTFNIDIDSITVFVAERNVLQSNKSIIIGSFCFGFKCSSTSSDSFNSNGSTISHRFAGVFISYLHFDSASFMSQLIFNFYIFRSNSKLLFHTRCNLCIIRCIEEGECILHIFFGFGNGNECHTILVSVVGSNIKLLTVFGYASYTHLISSQAAFFLEELRICLSHFNFDIVVDRRDLQCSSQFNIFILNFEFLSVCNKFLSRSRVSVLISIICIVASMITRILIKAAQIILTCGKLQRSNTIFIGLYRCAEELIIISITNNIEHCAFKNGSCLSGFFICSQFNRNCTALLFQCVVNRCGLFRFNSNASDRGLFAISCISIDSYNTVSVFVGSRNIFKNSHTFVVGSCFSGDFVLIIVISRQFESNTAYSLIGSCHFYFNGTISDFVRNNRSRSILLKVLIKRLQHSCKLCTSKSSFGSKNYDAIIFAARDDTILNCPTHSILGPLCDLVCIRIFIHSGRIGNIFASNLLSICLEESSSFLTSDLFVRTESIVTHAGCNTLCFCPVSCIFVICTFCQIVERISDINFGLLSQSVKSLDEHCSVYCSIRSKCIFRHATHQTIFNDVVNVLDIPFTCDNIFIGFGRICQSCNRHQRQSHSDNQNKSYQFSSFFHLRTSIRFSVG